MIHNLSLAALSVHLVALTATQTVYGSTFSVLRWQSLFAMFLLGLLDWVGSVHRATAVRAATAATLLYLAAWAITVVNSDYPLFSFYRLSAHALVVTYALVFLPRTIKPADASVLMIGLKIIVGGALVSSVLWPAQLNVEDIASMQRGVFGNANSMGHIGAVGCLIFLHGVLAQRRPVLKIVSGAFAATAAYLVFRSGARSSAAALVAALPVLWHFHRAKAPRFAVIGVVASLLVLVVAGGIGPIVDTLSGFTYKHGRLLPEEGGAMARIAFSRQTPFESHLRGFLERPLVGWGFGVDSDADLSNWKGELSSAQFTGRDPVNDVMYTLETGGVLGLAAYVFILTLGVQAWRLGARMARSSGGSGPGVDSWQGVRDSYQVYMSLTVMLVILFQGDSTALAAGNLFAALLWVSMGISLALGGILSTLHGPITAVTPP